MVGVNEFVLLHTLLSLTRVNFTYVTDEAFSSSENLRYSQGELENASVSICVRVRVLPR